MRAGKVAAWRAQDCWMRHRPCGILVNEEGVPPANSIEKSGHTTSGSDGPFPSSVLGWYWFGFGVVLLCAAFVVTGLVLV